MSVRNVVRGRLGDVSGIGELEPLEARVASLEVAVAENTALAAALVRVVDDLERAVAGAIERSHPDAVGT